jgi:uncharacterized protein (DUF1778 family)
MKGVEIMPVSQAQQRAVAKYNAANYDTYLLRLKKGQKDEIAAFAEKAGLSLNGFILSAITEAMSTDINNDISRLKEKYFSDIAEKVKTNLDELITKVIEDVISNDITTDISTCTNDITIDSSRISCVRCGTPSAGGYTDGWFSCTECEYKNYEDVSEEEQDEEDEFNTDTTTDISIKKCLKCGKEIREGRVDKKYCSANCRKGYYRDKKKQTDK